MTNTMKATTLPRLGSLAAGIGIGTLYVAVIGSLMFQVLVAAGLGA